MGQTTTLELAGGATELVGFFGDLFGVTHIPKETPKGGVVICSPLYSEFLKNNRREVMLGRRLADQGHAVQRFHYRGTGNSGGDPSTITLESMAEDASAALARLTEVTGVGEADVVGTRLASMPAASIAGPGSRLALWEPIVEGKRFFRELTRSLLILGVKQGGSRTPQDLEQEFEETGALDIAGFSVARSLRDSAVGSKLEIPSGAGAVMIVQLGRSGEIRKDLAGLVSAAEGGGRSAEAKPLDYEEAWWFHQDVNLLRPEEGALLDDVLVDMTSEWLAS